MLMEADRRRRDESLEDERNFVQGVAGWGLCWGIEGAEKEVDVMEGAGSGLGLLHMHCSSVSFIIICIFAKYLQI